MYPSLQEIIDLEQETGIPFWELIRREECEETKISPEKLFEQMRTMILLSVPTAVLPARTDRKWRRPGKTGNCSAEILSTVSWKRP